MATLTCEQCTRSIPVSTSRWGGAVICPHCEHLNVLPPGEPASAPTPPSRGRRKTTTWLAAGAVVAVVLVGWLWLRPPLDAPGSDPTPSMAPSDALQERLLRQNIGHAGDADLARVFDAINNAHFAAALPRVPVVWEPELENVGKLARDEFRLEGMYGVVGAQSMILLNTALRDDPKAIARALSHEMVHAYLHRRGDSMTTHGPPFQEVLRRLADEGAFEGVPSTPAERTALRSWINAEAARLEAARLELEQLGESIEAERRDIESGGHDEATLVARQTVYNARATEANARVDAWRTAQRALGEQIARYNLMVVYPDGLAKPDASRIVPGG